MPPARELIKNSRIELSSNLLILLPRSLAEVVPSIRKKFLPDSHPPMETPGKASANEGTWLAQSLIASTLEM
jgi:hypothetical protein